MSDPIESLFDERIAKPESPGDVFVRVCLMGDGQLALLLRNGNGFESRVPLSDKDCADTLRTVLEGQMAGRVALGLDGSPTAQKVWHETRHKIFPDERCPFCREVGLRVRGEPDQIPITGLLVRQRGRLERDLGGGASLKRLPSKAELEEKKLLRSKKPSRFDHEPLYATPQELRQWRQDKAKWERDEAKRQLGKQGKTTLSAAKLGF